MPLEVRNLLHMNYMVLMYQSSHAYCCMCFNLFLLFLFFLPGLESEVVGEISLGVQQGLLVTLSMYQLALSQPETPLLYVQDDWIWQVAPHDKQWTKNHLRQGIQKPIIETYCQTK